MPTMPNPLCHFELMTNNSRKCQAFYGSVFDWRFDNESLPGYTLIHTDSEATGGVFPKPKAVPGVCLNVYFKVDNIDETLEKVKLLGGSVLVPKTEIPNTGYFAMFADPEGIPIGIMRPAE